MEEQKDRNERWKIDNYNSAKHRREKRWLEGKAVTSEQTPREKKTIRQ